MIRHGKQLTIGKPPGGKLEKAFFPAVEITQEITPVNIFSPAEGVWIVDMGVNFTGTYKIKLSGSIGDTIALQVWRTRLRRWKGKPDEPR